MSWRRLAAICALVALLGASGTHAAIGVGAEGCLPRRVAGSFGRRMQRVADGTETARRALTAHGLVRAAHALARADRTLAGLRARLVRVERRASVSSDCDAGLRAALDALAARIAAVRAGDAPLPTTTSTTLASPSTTATTTPTTTTTTSTTIAGGLCGNGVLDRLEQCDGTNLFGRTCVTLGFPGGELRCGRDCLFDVSHCAHY